MKPSAEFHGRSLSSHRQNWATEFVHLSTAPLDVFRNVPAYQTPYEIYLASRQIGSRPVFWSKKGTVLLNQLIGHLPRWDYEIKLTETTMQIADPRH
jgi:hypothetical protein